MKTTLLAIAAAAALAAGPALAAGDPEKGAKAFSQCQTCHVVINGEGKLLAGRAAKTGPNLYGVIGRQAGIVEGFKYGNDLVKAGAQGLVWDEANFVAYVQDPAKFLREALGDSKARSMMTFKVRKADDAADLYAYLVSLTGN